MENKDNICAIVVTYKRCKMLRECINGILSQTRQLDKIYVVDNDSKDGTEEMTQSDFNFPYIEYINIKGENIGPAACWEIAMKKALKEGFDWLWLMDDDSLPKHDALEKLLSKSSERYVLNSLVVSKEDSEKLCFGIPKRPHAFFVRLMSRVVDIEKYANNGLFPWANFFNGTLLKRDVITKIGFPNRDLFIWGDEVEYLLRIQKVFKVYTVVNSILYHPNSDSDIGKVPLWKFYYKVRNQMMISKNYSRLRLLSILKNIIRFLVKKPRDFTIQDLFRAISDGLQGNLGKVE